MNWQGWAEIALTLGLAVAIGWPLGVYMSRVWNGERTWLDPVLKPFEAFFYTACGVDAKKSQSWWGYAGALLAFNFVGFLIVYGVLRLQGVLPMNPQGFPGLSGHLSFNTAISFVTNTNWQSYAGETTMSTLSQMLVLLGMPQTLAAGVTAHTLEGADQKISLYAVASQEAVKMLGINGGGIFNANSAHPFENPTPLTNLITAVSMDVLGWAAFFAFGRSVLAKKDVRALVIAAALLLSAGAGVVYVTETQTPPAQVAAGVDTSVNMEGKETRFGAPATAAWVAMTTGASNGSVNGMHSSLMPLGGGMAMFLMHLGEILPGGIGSGIAIMVVMAVLSVFVAGLMVGRTPEYLGKKIEAREVQLAILAVLAIPVATLGFSAIAAILPEALKGLMHSGPHGMSEILYAYTSATANNGSAFAGLTANAPWWDTTMGVAMAMGRFMPIVAVLAMAGSLVGKPKLAPSAGTLPTHGGLFIGLLVGVILILGGLQFFPALALGPIVEHFQVLAAVAHAH